MRDVGTRHPLTASSAIRLADEGCVEVQAEVAYHLTPLPQAPKQGASKIAQARAECDAIAKLCGWN